jgi:hypothetical protein
MPPGEQPILPPEPAVLAELRTLVAQAKKGDVDAQPRLRVLLDEYPEIWKHIGDLERIIVRAWAERLAGQDPTSFEVVTRKAEQLRAELGGDDPTPIEKLLVGQVVSTWLEMMHAQASTADAGKLPRPQAKWFVQRAESVQRRYLAAIKLLTTVRALLPQGLVPVSKPRLFEPRKKMA